MFIAPCVDKNNNFSIIFLLLKNCLGVSARDDTILQSLIIIINIIILYMPIWCSTRSTTYQLDII